MKALPRLITTGGIVMNSSISRAKLPLQKLLRELYTAQQCSFFIEDGMDKIMHKFSLSEEQAIDLVKLLMKDKLITTKAFLPAVFLCSRNIRHFPIVLSTKAIKLLKVSSGGQ